MGLLDNIIDIFLGGPDDWEARLLPEIALISPEGNEFSAKWIGDSRSMDKKLGIFAFPKVRGNIVQDLDVNSTRYSTPIFFDGKDCDINAQAFFTAAKERGVWTVTHPMHDFLELQMVSIQEVDELVTKGGVVGLEIEWLEPIDETTLLTAAEEAGLLGGSIDDLNLSAAEQFAANLNDSTEALANGIDLIVNGVTNLTDAALAPLNSSVDFLNNATNLIQNGIQDTLNATVLDVLSLGGQIQQLIQLPALATTSVAASQEYYSELATNLVAELPLPGSVSAQDRNDAIVLELALGSVIAAVAKGATSAPLETREQAVEAAVATVGFLNTVTDSLDSVQKSFEGESIDDQYFSQPLSYPDATQTTASAVRYLLLAAFDLKVARRFLVGSPRSPIEIAATEYGSLGENDSNLDLFIKSNNLSGNDIYLLPANREVVVYA